MSAHHSDVERDRDAYNRRERKVFAAWMMATTLLVVLTVGLMAWVGARARDRWEAFKTANDCRKVAVVRGGVNVSPAVGAGIGISPSGQITTGAAVGTVVSFDNDKVAWLCKDGVTYWR